VHEKDKEDVIRFGQNVHTTQTFSKKETLKRPFSSLEGSITKLLTLSSPAWCFCALPDFYLFHQEKSGNPCAEGRVQRLVMHCFHSVYFFSFISTCKKGCARYIPIPASIPVEGILPCLNACCSKQELEIQPTNQAK